MKYLILILCFTLLVNCNAPKEKTNNNIIERSMNQTHKSETELKEAILYKGDTIAYYELNIAYLDHSFQEEFLIYAIIMANKYDYTQAYYDVFYNIRLPFKDINDIDKSSAKIAIEYLLKAAEKGHVQAKEMVVRYSITKNQDSKEVLLKIFEE
jgi:hypothetical protein